jgi:hypothetical protein
MTIRTIQILERVQWFSLHAAAYSMIAGAAVALLVLIAMVGLDMIGWG